MTESILEKYKPFKRTLCRCASDRGGSKCICCELIEALEAETVARREAEAAIQHAIDDVSHVSRFRFLLSWIQRQEKNLLHWPAWLAMRERIRAGA